MALTFPPAIQRMEKGGKGALQVGPGSPSIFWKRWSWRSVTSMVNSYAGQDRLGRQRACWECLRALPEALLFCAGSDYFFNIDLKPDFSMKSP